jgi:type I restriction enzyme S subunit
MTEDGFKVYGQEHVIAADFDRGSKYIDPARFAELAVCEIRPGDLVVTMMGSSGQCAVVPDGIKRGIMDSHLLRIRLPDAELDPSFLCLLIDESSYVRDQIAAHGKGAIMQGLNSGIIKSIVLAVPPTSEQPAILSFLDRETARIDALVAKKERLIELLQEKRTALITRAVTKGLDPNVPMKDSGVEWLGEIPAHWHCLPLKRTILSRPGAIKTGPFGSQLLASEMQGGDVKVYNQKNVIDGDLIGGENFISRDKFKELSAFEVYRGDLLVTTRGTIGRCTIVPEDADEGILHPCLMRIQPDPKQLHRSFLALLIQDSILVQTQLALASNATTIDVIYSETMGQVLVPKPPLDEQASIVRWVGQRTLEIDNLIRKVSDAVDCLRGLRTALISAAVTGKIDVREEAA